MIPATISSTTEGSRKRGKRPSRNGAPNAMTVTRSRPENEGIPLRPSSGPSVTRGASPDRAEEEPVSQRLHGERAGERPRPADQRSRGEADEGSEEEPDAFRLGLGEAGDGGDGEDR